MNRFWSNRWTTTGLAALLVLVVLYLLLLIKPILLGVFAFLKAVLAPFLIAIAISYVLNPIVASLNKRKVPRTMAVLLIYTVFITCVIVFLMNIIPMMMRQMQEINEHMPQLTMRAQSLYDGLHGNRLMPDGVRSGVNQAITELENGIASAVSGFVDNIGVTINYVMVAFIVPFLAFYILKDVDGIQKGLLAVIPKAHRQTAVKLFLDIDTALGNYVRGQFLVCLVIGVLAYIGYWMIGMPYALLLASIVAVFNIIPYLGPFFGAAPALVMASTVSLKMMLLVAVVNVVCQILEGNVISPQIVGRTLHMHPLFIIFALLVGGEVAGVTGLILAVPFFAVGKVILQHVFLYYIQRPK
ncbi:AI-2E family transporter [Paenibacillus sp. y28]|uniref:AI-2E family transporter n=1 Tax=Paenibacillus sp. y28 TaxID=3129110 RepID=UPI0030184A13